MSTTNELFLEVMALAIRCQAWRSEAELPQGELVALLRLAEEQKVLPLVFDAVCTSKTIRKVNLRRLMAIQKQAVRWISRQVEQTNEFLVMLHSLQAQGLDPVVMKGLVCRELYPQPMLRYSVDEDLLVSDDDFAVFHEAIKRHVLPPYPNESDLDKTWEFTYHDTHSPLNIELHRRMFMPDQEAYGLLVAPFAGVLSRTTTIHVQGIQVRTLAPTDHLLFLIFHAYKHFLYSGVGIRQVCDIGLFAERYADQLDWPHIVSACADAHMGDFPTALFRIADKHLGLHAKVPQEWCKEVDEQPLLLDMLSGGLMGDNDVNRIHSSNITLGAVTNNGGRHHRLSGLLNALFPSADYIRNEYPYVARCRLLLPIGWLHRIVAYLCSHKGSDTKTTIKIGQERIELLRHYSIIE